MTSMANTNRAALRGNSRTTPRSRRRLAGYAGLAGYTMIEVIMGLSVLAVGGMSIAALLRFTVVGTLDSRHVANATQVSSTFIEQMQLQALNWRDRFNADCNAGGCGGMPLIGPAATSAAGGALGNPGAWTWPGSNAVMTNAVTLDGQIAAVGNEVAYCTHVRANWPGQIGGVPPNTNGVELMRVEVRTFWARSGRTMGQECAGIPPNAPFWTDPLGVAAAGGVNRSRAEYGVVYLTTVIRRNTL